MTSRRLSWAALLIVAITGRPLRGTAQAGDNPHGTSVGACVTCHLPDAWRPIRIAASFRHAERTFPLDGAHQTAACTACHTSLDFSRAAPQCASCHKDVHRAELGVECARCHTTRSFVDQARLIRMHETTLFPLRGAHVAVACESCHVPTQAGQPQYVNRPTTCISCHRTDYDRVATPPHRAAGFPTTCTTCHTETTWRGAPFDHNATQFALTGAHQAVACSTCHADGVYKGKPTACNSCHQADYDKTAAPPHAPSGFAITCTSCHTTTRWEGAPFDHSATQFALTGGHRATTCAACHSDGVYRGKPTDCASCHRADYDKTTSPPHGAAAFSTTCTSCHTTTAWQGATFDHGATRFPLTGGHQAVACAQCHADGVYHGKPTTCVACHRADFDKTADPPHASAGYSTDCTGCHSTTTWLNATFDHTTTQFPLTGAHLTVACSTCHADGVFRGKPTACVACHQPDFDRTTTPPHAAAAFATTCATCHSTTTWQGATFDHGTTAFPLTGAHLTVACSSCHADGVFRGKPTACVACHRADYDKTVNPAHASAGYSTDCTICHTVSAWQGANFDHATTQFPLTGAHAAVPCSSCHGDGVFRGKPTACVTCHQADFDRTNAPPHAAAAFATTCATCHVTSTWQGAVFDHATTRFPLTGGHAAVPCASCHADGVYRGKPMDCVACHRPDYDKTADPPHSASGFSTTCTTCHTVNTWLGAAFDHNATQFPLTGSHLAVACNTCHADGVFKGKPTACVSCHRPEYDRTATPPHAAAGFPTTCSTCHATTNWLTATFDHAATGWALTGVHASTPCASCHGDGVYQGKSNLCASCHQASYDATVNPNHKSASFPTTCESCHTTTTWLGATFDHDNQYFPIYSGTHRGRWTRCSDCHTSSTNFTVFTCTTCHGKNGTDSNHRSVPGYQYQSSACYTCHPRGRAG